MKRPNGEGTIRKRKNGTWEGKYVAGRDKDGKLIRHSVYGRTQGEVSKKLTALQHLLVTGVIAAMTVLVHFALSSLAGDTWMKFAQTFGWNVALMQWLDSAIFAIGIVAVILEALRYKEQYIWWLITDVIAVAQYALKRDAVYTTKKAIYLVEAIVGLKNWHELSKKNKTNE